MKKRLNKNLRTLFNKMEPVFTNMRTLTICKRFPRHCANLTEHAMCETVHRREVDTATELRNKFQLLETIVGEYSHELFAEIAI